MVSSATIGARRSPVRGGTRVNRTDFQKLAEVRLAESKALLDAGLWSGAYYLAGYVVECALKACIAKLTRAEEFPPNKKTVEDYYTHDLMKLVGTAKLATEFADALKADSQLDINWNVVRLWKEGVRYEVKEKVRAEELYDAITDPAHGVLQWIQSRW